MVGTVFQKTVPIQVQAIGNVQASTTVAIRSLVAGEIVGVHFTEGQDVHKGDLLFTIDTRPYEASLKQAEANLAKSLAAVKQAEANLARDNAQAKTAVVQADRYKTLFEKNLISKEQYDQIRTTAESLDATIQADKAALENVKATVQADRAAIENAKLQLSYCSIRAPVSGRTGSLLVDKGNVVKANDSQSLAVVNQINPVNVEFSVPEKVLPAIRRYMTASKLLVEVFPQNGGVPAEAGRLADTGYLSFINNTIDNTTGTIQLKATFQNKSRRLWPGQFVNVMLTLAMEKDAVVVPAKAVQTGQQGQFVFVVKKDMAVESRPVSIERTIDQDAVVSKGLIPGETVVVDGQLQLVPGAKVTIKKPNNTPAGRGKPA
jgi:membrane fusion protein, multidrug efflux system